MSLNEWLCKNFETNDDGNVTIGTVFGGTIGKIFSHPATPYLIVLTSFSWFFGLIIELSIVDPQSKLSIFSFMVLPLIYGYSIVLLFTIIYLILKFISNIKLAKCRLK